MVKKSVKERTFCVFLCILAAAHRTALYLGRYLPCGRYICPDWFTHSYRSAWVNTAAAVMKTIFIYRSNHHHHYQHIPHTTITTRHGADA